MKAEFRHINIVARDLRGLAGFYRDVFGCLPIQPERELSGSWLAAATGVSRPELRSIQLSLPGVGKDGPALEIFQYSHSLPGSETRPDREGFGHLAFEVDDVPALLAEVLARGGSALGKAASREFSGVGLLTFVYAADPEGNIIELLNWNRG